MEDLARLVAHLELLARVAVLLEGVDMREHVERDLVRELLGRREVLATPVGGELGVEFRRGGCPRAGHGLVGGRVHTLERGDGAHRVQHEGERGGGAVRDRDDALVPLDIGPVDLGHDERDVRLHAERGAVVDEDAAGVGDPRTPHP